MEKHTIEIVVCDKENIIKYIPLIKKYTKESIGEIRDKALKEISVVICEYTKSTEKLEQLLILIQELEKKGAEIKILRKARNKYTKEIDLGMVKNLIKSGQIIDKQVSDIIDLEVGEN